MAPKTRKSNVAVSAPKVNNETWNPMSVKWIEKHDKLITRMWDKLPDTLSKVLATLAVFMVGISINGKS